MAEFECRGRRLKLFFTTCWRGTKNEFCRAMGIDRDELEEYFSGIYDPMEFADALVRIGVDIHYLVTGEHLTSLQELAAKEALRDRGIVDYEGVCRLLDESWPMWCAGPSVESYSARLRRVYEWYTMHLN